MCGRIFLAKGSSLILVNNIIYNKIKEHRSLGTSNIKWIPVNKKKYYNI